MCMACAHMCVRTHTHIYNCHLNLFLILLTICRLHFSSPQVNVCGFPLKVGLQITIPIALVLPSISLLPWNIGPTFLGMYSASTVPAMTMSLR